MIWLLNHNWLFQKFILTLPNIVRIILWILWKITQSLRIILQNIWKITQRLRTILKIWQTLMTEPHAFADDITNRCRHHKFLEDGRGVGERTQDRNTFIKEGYTVYCIYINEFKCWNLYRLLPSSRALL